MKSKKILITLLLFIFALTFFRTKSFAGTIWERIYTGNKALTESSELVPYGFSSNLNYTTKSIDENGRWTYIYEWNYQDVNYKLEYTTWYSSFMVYNWNLYKMVESGEKINTNEYKVTLNHNDTYEFFKKGANIIKILRNFAIIISVVALSIIGVRYMLGSVEQKAEYKQTMMPVVIGCILIGGLSTILTIIQSIF